MLLIDGTWKSFGNYKFTFLLGAPVEVTKMGRMVVMGNCMEEIVAGSQHIKVEVSGEFELKTSGVSIISYT